MDRILDALRAASSGFDYEVALTKTVAVNRLYGAGVMPRDLERVAEHVCDVMPKQAVDQHDVVGLVTELARVRISQPGDFDRYRNYWVFGSKFAHFFVDPVRFPICDSDAEQIVAFHLGPAYRKNTGGDRYQIFVENVALLRKRNAITCTHRELDHYLWLAGEYTKWAADHSKGNGELRHLFQTRPDWASVDLDAAVAPFA